MPRVSFRTLTLMLLLLVSVLTHQYINWAPVAHAHMMWLAGDDPNEPEPEVSNAGLGLFLLGDDPNEPEPEMAGWALGLSYSGDEPNEPEPELVGWALGLFCCEDDPNEPEPEVA